VFQKIIDRKYCNENPIRKKPRKKSTQEEMIKDPGGMKKPLEGNEGNEIFPG
jgi:hypothetical protein